MAHEFAIAAVGMPLLDIAALEATDASALAALRNFEDRLGEATEREFLDLVKLLHHVGCSTEAEYLLRSNLLRASEDEQSLFEDTNRLAAYKDLFGSAKQEALAAAIAAFSKQISAELTNEAGSTFAKGYYAVPQCVTLNKYRIQNERCYVRLDYDSRDIEATLESLKEPDQLLFFRWVKDAWQLMGTGCSTVVEGDNSEA